MRVFYELVYTTDRTQIRKEKIRIQLHGGEKTIQASDFLRGKYVCESSSLCFRDLFDFFCIELHTKKESVLRPLVFPAQTAESVQTPIPFIPALESDNKNSSLRTQDMYESRPYIPGDDLRKINWKVYAHTQELAVRQGDFTPPPIQSFFVFIEEPCGRQNKKVLSAIYDECIAKVCGFLLELQKHEPDIIFLFAAKRGAIQTAKLLHTDAESQNKIQSLLAIPQVQKTPHGIQIQNLLPVLAAESILLYFYLPLESNVHPLQTLSASPVNKKIVFLSVSIKPSKTLSLYEKLLYQNKFEKQRSTLSAKIASAAEIHLAEYERKKPVCLCDLRFFFVFRILSWLLVLLIPSLHSAAFFPFFVLPLTALFSITAASIIFGKTTLNTRAAFLLSCGLTVLFSFFILVFLALIASSFTDILYLRIRILLPVLLLVQILCGGSTIAYLKIKRWKTFEPVVLLILFACLFWNQADYQLSVFSHSFYAGVFAAAFTLLCLVPIIVEVKPFKKLFIFFTLFILLIAVSLLLILNTYNKFSVAKNGGLLQQTLFKFDFSPFLTLQDEIKISDNLLFLVHIQNEYSYAFLRRMYLGGWEKDKGFYEKAAYDEVPQTTQLPKNAEDLPHQKFGLREKVSQEYFIVNIDSRSFMAIDYPTKGYPL
ncbi:DUF58 domain-containing protein [Treponema phagedenis]|uniref:DUF58 domain-containing protein n=1 Tax=Treponema phagedenis TaxID=162 RepID=UPI0015A63A5D|nr:DUF58 domain-containing protein [Treponema phagedenis]NVP25727.1 DUF58 domain-containing protein [Treponema phagedenis]